MNPTEDNQYVIDLKLLKYLGLYQILDPNTKEVYGCNIYHFISIFIALPLIAVSLLCPFGLYNLLNDITASLLYFGSVNNYLFSCYKMYNIAKHAKDIWACIDVTRRDFMLYRAYNRNVFNYWQKHTLRVMYSYLCVVLPPVLIWYLSPCVFRNTTVAYKNMDGTYSKYRMNIINLYMIVSTETYNRNFYKFYFFELAIYSGFYYFSLLYDILVGMLSFALSCQLETISDGIHSLGYESQIDNFGKYVFSNFILKVPTSYNVKFIIISITCTYHIIIIIHNLFITLVIIAGLLRSK